MGAAVAQWIRLRLPSCRLGLNPKHTTYAFINLNLNLNCDVLKRQNKQKKRPRLTHFKKLPPNQFVINVF